MKKIALSPYQAQGLKRLGVHALGGAAIGGFASHRADKFDPKNAKKRGRTKAGRLAKGVIGGAALGGAYGVLHDVTTPKLNEGAVASLKDRLKSGGKPFYDVHRAVGTVAGAGLGGAKGYYDAKAHNKKQGKNGQKKVDPLAAAAFRAGVGASLGHTVGSFARWGHLNQAARVGGAAGAATRSSSKNGVPEWLKGVKTKTDAKKAYHAQASQHHPDKGGNAEKFKEVAGDWEHYKKHHFDKLSHFLPGFFNELSFIEG